MKKNEKNALIEWASKLSNDELEEEYYKSAYDCLGSQTDKMYELGYDLVDIEERDKFETYLCEKSDVLEQICAERGIALWQ